ncbi:MAG: asparagine synthase (glutamine-hydrolyzing) [Desulfobacteraceae bacterium]|nr:MAG: asparagine synthase (glutamine-hydrolyzing) [Desulfobacteraceae bacterium]
MCGICGFIGKGDVETLTRMNSALTHRGPDGEGLWHHNEEGVYLGHKRLSIIDIEGGIQPMWSGDGRVGVVFNGEIYNHLSLREELSGRGHVFGTDHSDTEVLIHGYLEWGFDLPLKLDGMWAFAIYDRDRKLLFLSRDRFGKKPLFYSLQNGTFAFASELSALVKHPNIRAGVSAGSLKKYFAYGYIPAPKSLYENVCKLPGGFNLLVDVSALRTETRKYWEFVLEPFELIPENPEETWGEELRSLLEEAVRKRLMSDVPLGIFLSGGIDSSAITAFASRHVPAGRLKTFSIGFEEASFDESAYAGTVADYFQTEHYQERLSIERARDLLPEVVSRLDEPMGDSSLLPTYLLCQSTRKHVTVALGGDGGDELFAGYDPFRALKMAEWYDRIVPRPLHRAITMAAGLLPVSHRNMSLDFKLKRTLRGLSFSKSLWNPIWLGPLSPIELSELFHEPTDLEETYEEAIRCWDSCNQQDLVDKTLQFYTRLYLQDDILVKVDRASMMHSLEVRAPFLDIDLVDFARRIPHSYKFRKGQTKYILKEALRPVLPRNILFRAKKGFGAPVGKWFREKELSLRVEPLPDTISHSWLQNAAAVHSAGKRDERALLWNSWVLGSFFQQSAW